MNWATPMSWAKEWRGAGPSSGRSRPTGHMVRAGTSSQVPTKGDRDAC